MTNKLPTDSPGQDYRLHKLPGINIEAGLRVSQYNKAVYRRLLIKFRDSWSEYRQAFDDALRNDPAEMGHLAHNLKGVAANLGIEQVQQLADELELASRENQSGPVADACHRLYPELERVIRGLKTLD